MRGKFIVIEGADGAGTTTQATLLAGALSDSGIRASFTCEPTDGEIGILIRMALRKEIGPFSWETMALLFAADRVEHSKKIVAALATETIVCDRYVLSSIIYQSISANVIFAGSFIEVINATIHDPDLTIILDVRPDVARRRREARRGKEELFEAAAFQERVCMRYTTTGGPKAVHVDGNRDQDAVHDEILSIVLPEVKDR